MIILNKHKSFNINNLLKILVLITPLTLVGGNFLVNLSVSFTAILFIYITVKKNLYYLYYNKFFYLFILFYFYLLFNIFFINNNAHQSFKVIGYIRFGVFFVALSFVNSIFPDFKKKLYYLLCLLCFFLIIDGLVQYFFGSNLFLNKSAESERIASFFGNELVYGSYLSRFYPLIIGLFILLYEKEKLNKYLFIFLMIGIPLLVFLSGERSALLYILISSLYLLTLLEKFKFLRIFTIVLSICFFFIIINFNPQLKDRIFVKSKLLILETSRMILSDSNTIFDENNNLKRLDSPYALFFKTSLKIFENNKLFGIGPNNFRYMCNKKKYYIYHPELTNCSTHPHNTYVQILAELGLVGIFFSLIVFCFLIQKSLIRLKELIFNKKKTNTDFEICIYACLLISFWPIVFTGGFFSSWLSSIYFFPVGFLINNEK